MRGIAGPPQQHRLDAMRYLEQESGTVLHHFEAVFESRQGSVVEQNRQLKHRKTSVATHELSQCRQGQGGFPQNHRIGWNVSFGVGEVKEEFYARGQAQCFPQRILMHTCLLAAVFHGKLNLMPQGTVQHGAVTVPPQRISLGIIDVAQVGQGVLHVATKNIGRSVGLVDRTHRRELFIHREIQQMEPRLIIILPGFGIHRGNNNLRLSDLRRASNWDTDRGNVIDTGGAVLLSEKLHHRAGGGGKRVRSAFLICSVILLIV